MALTITLGCVVVSFFLLMLNFSFGLSLLYPIITLGLMKLVHLGLRRSMPGSKEGRNVVIQQSFIGGGALSVFLAFLTGKVPPEGLGYTAIAMGLFTLIILALDLSRESSKTRRAEKSLLKVSEARQLMKAGELKQADELLQESLLTSELAYGSWHPQIALICLEIADLMRMRGRVAPALNMYKRGVGVFVSLRQAGREMVTALYQYAEYQRLNSPAEEAVATAEWAISEARKLEGADDLTGRALLTLAKLQESQDDLKTANETSQSAAKLLEKSLGRSHPETLQAKSLVAHHCIELRRMAEAERILREVMAEKQRLKDDQDAVYLNLTLDLWTVQSAANQNAVADSTLLKAIGLYRADVGPEYERADELVALIPDFLAPPEAPGLSELYRYIFAKDNSNTRRVLESDPSLAKVVDRSGWTPIQWAAFHDQGEIIAMLSSRDADVEFGKGTDMPALYVAARWARRGALATLFRRDPDIEIESGDGSRPVHGAIRSGDNVVFDQVMGKRATLEVANKRGWTPLHEAAYVGDRKLLLELIPKGLDVNHQSGTTRETPLHAAVLGGHFSTVESLILNMANPHAADSEGKTPLELAEDRNLMEIIDILTAHGPDEPESTPLEPVASPEVAVEEKDDGPR